MNKSSLVFNVNASQHPTLDVFGPTIQFLMTPEEAGESLCVLKGIIPPGSFVPLHSHDDVECFYMVAGYQEALIEAHGELVWKACNPGDFIRIPGGAKHAFRNLSSESGISISFMTAKLGRFFEEVGRPLSPGQHAPTPTPEELQEFVQIAVRYGYWLGAPDENATAGIPLFKPA
jgi:quercetin dioxygenase-like cupin family protein